MQRFAVSRRRHGRPTKRGFTLVELLVVIAIIGILIALLLPAVQAAREAGRRASCINNLKNLALGLVNYHDTHQALPPGFIHDSNATESWGWSTFVLPFIEQQPLYEKLNPKERRLTELLGSGTAQEQELVQTVLSIYRCPSDTSPDLLPTGLCGGGKLGRTFVGVGSPTGWPASGYVGFAPATSNYPGNAGLWDVASRTENNGIFHGDSKVALGEIFDGTSNTFLLGERDRRCVAGCWVGARNPPGNGMYGSYHIRGRVSVKLNDPRDPATSTNNGHDLCTEGFSSPHPDGGHFAFCDGSVHFIADDIDFSNAGLTDSQLRSPRFFDKTQLGTYQRLGCRDDEQPVGEF